MRAGHLFAGIDGFGLGLGAVGIDTAWTAELADFPHAVLQLRVPDAEHYRDVTTLKNPPPVDVLTGGFPCQDLSLAGLGAGIGGSRSGLWTEYARIIGEVAPTVVLIENVPALLSRGFELVVENLLALGYVVEWDCLPAAAFGAPHLRDRVFVVAHHGDRPRVFGDPVGLFPHSWRDLPQRENGWRKWPRAGYVDTHGLVELAPLATIGDVRKGIVRLWPTPEASDGSGGRVAAELGGTRPSGAKRAVTLGTAVAHDLLPTPTASDGRNLATGESQFDRHALSLPAMAARGLWPTPASMDATSGHTGRADTKGRHSLALHHLANNGVLEGAADADDAVNKLDAIRWPTPKSSPSGPDFARAGREGSGGDDLATRVAKVEGLLPTPRASDGDARNRGDLIAHAKDRPNKHHPGDRPEGRDEERRTGALNPDWVEWLMGYPLGWTNPAVPNDAVTYHPWHDGEPDGLPRTAPNVEERKGRLTALGNALVPPAAAWLAARILPILEEDTHA